MLIGTPIAETWSPYLMGTRKTCLMCAPDCAKEIHDSNHEAMKNLPVRLCHGLPPARAPGHRDPDRRIPTRCLLAGTDPNDDVFPGAKFKGSVTTPPGWGAGTWNYVQLIKGQRKYTYQGGAKTHLGDGSSLKLDERHPYSSNFPADGTPADDDSCSDTPRGSLTGTPPPNQQSTPRIRFEVHESFETYIMFKPPGGSSSCPVPLRRAKWKWGGTVSSSNNWSPVDGPEASDSDKSGAEYFEHPKWAANAGSDQETTDP